MQKYFVSTLIEGLKDGKEHMIVIYQKRLVEGAVLKHFLYFGTIWN